MYEYTDRIIKYLTKRIIRTFTDSKSRLLHMDELNVLSYSKTMYAELRAMTVTAYLRMAKRAYKDNLVVGVRKSPGEDKKVSKGITKVWLSDFLLEYDPVTKYVFEHEVERKQGRFAESVIACGKKSAGLKSAEIDKAMRYWSQMSNQYAINITDAAAVKAYKDSGIKKVMWVTRKDERTCIECRERDGKIYKIDEVPTKPHWGCRCTLKPVI